MLTNLSLVTNVLDMNVPAWCAGTQVNVPAWCTGGWEEERGGCNGYVTAVSVASAAAHASYLFPKSAKA